MDALVRIHTYTNKGKYETSALVYEDKGSGTQRLAIVMGLHRVQFFIGRDGIAKLWTKDINGVGYELDLYHTQVADEDKEKELEWQS